MKHIENIKELFQHHLHNNAKKHPALAFDTPPLQAGLQFGK